MKYQRRVAPRAPIKCRAVIRGAEARFPVLLSNIEWGCAGSSKVAILETGRNNTFWRRISDARGAVENFMRRRFQRLL